MADECFDLPTDIFVDILVRLPTSARRRFRLVSKRWRDIIDERTMERQVRTKILVFKSNRWRSRALIFGDQDGRRVHEWNYDTAFPDTVHVVGTCNGLICLHDSCKDDNSAITVANPITGEALALPVLPRAWGDSFRSFRNYSFDYHPTTGQYKVVHVPRCLSRRSDAVHVLTLDGSAWREVVQAKDVGYNPYFGGVISVDGAAYWFNSCGVRVMALDLKDERLTSFLGPPPVRSRSTSLTVGGISWTLTSVNARLGVAFPSYDYKSAETRVEVWVLESNDVEQLRWSRKYTLIDKTVRSWMVMTPHLTHGEYILTMSWDKKWLYRYKVSDCTNVDDEGTATQLVLSKGTKLIMSKKEGAEGALLTYAYVKTREPLPCREPGQSPYPLISTH